MVAKIFRIAWCVFRLVVWTPATLAAFAAFVVCDFIHWLCKDIIWYFAKEIWNLAKKNMKFIRTGEGE